MLSTGHILVIRFSAMGDVAMVVPVIKNALQQNPQLQITVVSNSFFSPLFTGLERCHFYGADLKGKHKGATGIFKLFKELKKQSKFNAIADLHGVLRSQLLKSFFKIAGIPIASIDKGRAEKKALTQKENKSLKQLPTSFERYAAVFNKLGININLNTFQSVYAIQPIPVAVQQLFTSGNKIIAVSPFAQHIEKMYPIEKMKTVVYELAKLGYSIFLFGAKGNESKQLQQWEIEISNVHNMAGKFSLQEELAIISNTKLMLSMDSANMHLAALFGIPVVSIWGATHPFAGFYGWGLSQNNIVSIDISCRPCSVFGNKPCYRGDHACMQQITEKMIVDKITTLIWV